MRAVLFDLDGTLLETNFQTFMAEYFQGVSRQFRPWMDPNEFLTNLMEATHVMTINMDETRTNLEVFTEDFFKRTSLDPALMDQFYLYYDNEFPKLEYLTKAHPLAGKAIETARNLDCKIVLATNPLFPRSAIMERMRWAGVDGYCFDLITAGDNMHFCKPNVEYYQEIARTIAVDPRDCLMIGDEPENDGVAVNCGMNTFILDERRSLAECIEFMLAGGV